jgi:uncharacterized protein (DUF1684 family)
MNNQRRTIGVAVFGLLLVPAVWKAEGGSNSASTEQEKSTAVMSVQLNTRSAAAPLEMRVSVQYVNSSAAEMLQVLAKAAGLTVEVPSAPLQPVTLTLTNVRLRTALDAICDTAACTWQLDGKTIKVSATGQAAPANGLPPTVSIALEEVSVRDVFRAIGAAINVPVTIEGNVERPPLTVKFTNADTTTVLHFLCKKAGCTWEFDGTALRVRFQAP